MRPEGGKWGYEGEEEGESLDQGLMYFGMSSVMKLWRGLRLERLVVEFDQAGTWYGKEDKVEWITGDDASRQWEESWMFGEVEAFVARGKGWREVELRIPSVACVAVSAGAILGRHRRALRERDVEGIIEEFVFEDESGEILKIEEAWELEGGMKVFGGDMVTRIRRGDGVNYSQDCGTEDEFERGLLALFGSRSWKQIREQGLYVEQGSD